jgi:hypothetical protein
MNSYDLTDNISAILQQNIPTLYYRLTQVDFDGNTWPSKTIVINLEGNKGNIIANAHPNPFNSQLNILVNSTLSESVEINLIDVSGRLIWKHQANITKGDNTVELSNIIDLKAGVYFLQIMTSQGIISQKVLKGE